MDVVGEVSNYKYMHVHSMFFARQLSIMGMSGAPPSSGALGDEVQLGIWAPHLYIHFMAVWHQLCHTQ